MLPLRSLAGAVALLALGSLPSRAVDVSFSLRDVADAQPGHDSWLYEYRLDAFPFDAGYGFTVYFDPSLYAALETALPGPGPDWDPIVEEPDVGLGADGFYDAEALADAPSTAVVFRVRFEWLGAGMPGDQPFEVREPAPSFAVVESGTTVVPEPSAIAQHGGAALALAAVVARARSRC